MKSNVTYAFIILLFSLMNYDLYSQCAPGPDNASNSFTFATTTKRATNINTGDREAFQIVQGGEYYFSTCGTSFDSQVSGFNASVPLFDFPNGNESDCIDQHAFCFGCPVLTFGNEQLTWVASFSGTLMLQVNQYNCGYVNRSAVVEYVQRDNVVADKPNDVEVACGGDATFTARGSITSGDPAEFDYQWEVSTNGGVNWDQLPGETGRSYTKTGVPSGDIGNLYRYKATLDKVTKTSPPATLLAATLDAPVAFEATDDNCQGEIDLTWEWYQPSPSSWKIEVSTDNTNWSDLATNISAGTRSYTHTNANRGTTYYYRVSGFDDACGLSGTPSEVTTGISPTDPLAPDNVSSNIIDITGGKAIVVSWTDNSDNEDGFIVERSLVSGGAIEKVEIVSSATEKTQTGVVRTYQDEDVRNCEPYRYRVYAYNACKPNGVRIDTDYAETTANVDILNVFDNPDNLVGSKGYFNNRIELKWNINNNSNFNFVDRFRIYSRRLGDTNDPALVAAVDAEVRTFDDERADAGVLFEYFIIAESDCGPNVIRSYDISNIVNETNLPSGLTTGIGYSIGYRSPSAIVNGNISYTGGIAVPNVKVVVEKESGASGNSLEFDGVDDFVNIPSTSYLSPTGEFSLSAWLKPNNVVDGVTQTVLNKKETYSLEIRNSSPYFAVKDASGTWHNAHADSIDLVDGQFINFFGVLDSDSIKLFVDGRLKAGKPLAITPFADNSPLFFAKNGDNANYFEGFIDEVRLYNRALDSAQVIRDYGRIVDPGTNDIYAYYSLNEGVGPFVFDASKTGRTYHANDGQINGAAWSTTIPDGKQLGIAGYTNNKGNYTISGIVYTGTGNNFNITPGITLGGAVHQFSPGEKTVFLGEGNSVINEVDFTDISSFKVTGQVLFDFANRDAGSPGVNFFIDGTQIVQDNAGNAIVTDAFGRFEIQVPIGNHTIVIQKGQHDFANNGKWPTTQETFDFQEPQSGIIFYDITTRKLAGRVVGGTTEGSKKIGFGKSNNNIGASEFYLRSQDNLIEVKVNPDVQTGEYDVELPPLAYTIFTDNTFQQTGIKIINNTPASNYFQNPQDPLEDVDLTKLEISQDKYEIDTTFTNDNPPAVQAIDSFRYNLKRNFVYRAVPQLTVTNGEAEKEGQKFNGEDFWVVTPRGEAEPDTLLLKDNAGNSVLPYPVFSRSERYRMKIALEEIYTNFDGAQPVRDTVKVTDAQLNITNQIGKGFYADPFDGSIKNYVAGEPGTNPDTLRLNSADGDTIYSFVAIEPDFETNVSVPELSFTKSIQVTARAGGNVVYWPGPASNDLFRGYVFGSKPVGTSFITKAPTVVDFILRDPPGGNSYAYMESGQKISTSRSFSLDTEIFTNLDLGIGVGQSTFIGLGVGVINEAETDATIKANFSSTIGVGNTAVNTYEVTERFTTNDDPLSVGAMSDIYVAKSENVRYGTAQSLLFVDQSECGADEVGCAFSENLNTDLTIQGKSGKSYEIASKIAFFIIPEGDPTFFVFSQNDIINILLPDLVSLRNSIMLNNGNYDSNLPSDHELYGANNDDPALTSFGLPLSSTNYPFTSAPEDFTGASYTFEPDNNQEIDSIRWFNQQIRLWEETIAQNEKEKVEAINGALGNPDNVSWAGLTDIERSVKSTHSETLETSFDLALGMSAGTSTDIDMFGISLSLDVEAGLKTTTNFKNEKEESSETTYGYVFSDPDQDDLFSVDVYDSDRGNGPVFVLKGGQTSCPFEDEELTKFYQTGTSIGERTLQREKPSLAVDVPVIYNVPDNEAAVFTLTLGNESETQDNVNYALQVLDETNPDGAVLRIDGAAFDSRKEFFVPGGGAIQKTLTIEKGAFKFDYPGIKVVIQSTCQYDPTNNDANLADTVALSAYFLPSCTEPEILTPKDQWVVNSSFSDTLDIAIGNFNINKAGFKEIDLQYKPSTSSGWIRIDKFYRDTTGLNDQSALQIPRDNPTINYEWSLLNLSDGTYDIRAVAACDVPVTQTTVFTESEIFNGLIDRVNPVPFGNPQPADGILSPGDEILIQFNETIDAGLLRPTNFDIRGVLNGGDVRIDASVFFGGVSNNYMKIPEGIDLTRKDFSIEFNVKPSGGSGKEVIISQGIDEANGLQIGLDASNKVYFKLGNAIVTSENPVVDDRWTHVAVTYKREETTASISINALTDKVVNNFVVDYGEVGPIFVAKNNYAPENNFTGNVHELRIWNKALSESEVTRFSTSRLSRSQADIIGNWRMDEATGDLTEDVIRSRNALVFGTWQVEPGGQAYEFDGDQDYITAPATAFGDEMNFTIEFWFRSSSSNAEPATFFTNGRGDGEASNTSGWEIGVNAEGQIMYANNGRIITATEEVYHDNNWHHLALVLTRFGNTNLYIDGEEKSSVVTEGFNSFGGPKFWMGARGSFIGSFEDIDQHFIGGLDEVRVWGTARREAQIVKDMHSKLTGDEPGLAAYYPFEEFINDSGVLISVTSDKDQTVTTRSEVDAFTEFGDPSFTENTPTIKQPRPVKAVNFTFTANGDRIILSPNDPDSLLENVILDITVSNIRDLNGNILQSPVTWSAFVNRNDLIWENQELSYNVPLGEKLTFTTKILNQGGQVRNYTISNLPPWLSVTPRTGVIEPLTSQTVTFEVAEGVNIGVYNEDIFVTSEFGFDERLSLNINVFDTPPDWDVNPNDFQFAMSVIGRVQVEGKFSRNPNDILAAFVDGEVRGVANLQYVEVFDNYQVFLQVYSNEVANEEIEYRFWNAAEGRIHTSLEPSVTGVSNFSSNATYGTATEPIIFNASNLLRNEFDLVSGWQWISINLNSPDMSNVDNFFKDYNATEGDQIKTQFEFDQYGPNGWNGTISNSGGLKNNALYKLNLANPGELNVEGSSIDPSTYDITVEFGWNWIGFVSQRNLNINEALANFDPIEGDQIKSQRQFAIYAGQAAGWIGNMTVLEPGQGYMLFSNDPNEKTFNYPSGGLLSGRTREEKSDFTYLTDGSARVNVHDYANNMSLVLTKSYGINEGDTLIAMINDEVRGVSVPTYNALLDDYSYFLTVLGNASEDSPIEFSLRTSYGEEKLNANATYMFKNNTVGGSLLDPIVLYEQGDIVQEPIESFVLSPNPFSSTLNLRFTLDQDADVEISLYNIAGQLVSDLFDGKLIKGNHNLNWSGREYGFHKLEKGMYLLRFYADDRFRTVKVIKE